MPALEGKKKYHSNLGPTSLDNIVLNLLKRQNQAVARHRWTAEGTENHGGQKLPEPLDVSVPTSLSEAFAGKTVSLDLALGRLVLPTFGFGAVSESDAQFTG